MQTTAVVAILAGVFALIVLACVFVRHLRTPKPVPLSPPPSVAPSVAPAPTTTSYVDKKKEIEAVTEITARERLQDSCATFLSKPAANWDLLLFMGDIYARGEYPSYLPDIEVADLCYRAAAMCPCGKVSGLAQMKLMELKLSPIPVEDVKGAKLPVEHGRRAYETAISAITLIPFSDFQTPRYATAGSSPPAASKKKEEEAVVVRPNNNIGTTSEDRIAREMLAAAAEARRVRVEEEEEAETRYKEDAQNVHDHAVTQAIHSNLKRLTTKNKKYEDEDDFEDTLIGVRDGILSHPDVSDATKDRALKVMDTLGDTKHSKFGKSEQDVLTAVWRDIVDPAKHDPEERKNLVETLASQLSSAIENNHVVCSSGKIARIAGTLDGVSNETHVRPLWAIREEIASLAAKMRDDGASRDAFVDRVTRTYVQDLGMNALILDPVIKEFAEHIE